MGTRSLTKIYNQFDGGLICTMYCHFDGYPSGVGADIKNCLAGITVVNGYNSDTPKPFVNRMGKLAVYLAKNSGIDYEIQSGDGSDWIDYIYHLKFNNGRVQLELESFGELIYYGLLDDFDPSIQCSDE